MTLTFNKIVEINNGFVAAQNITGSFKFSYALGKNIKKLKPFLEEKDEEVLSIAKASGLKSDKNGMYDFNGNEDALKAFFDFMKTERTIEFHKVDISELEKLNLSAKNLVDLELMIIDVEEKNDEIKESE
jgi:hypothetical protein